MNMPAVSICSLNPFDISANWNNSYYIRNILKTNNIYIAIKSDEYAEEAVCRAASILRASVTADTCLSQEQLVDLGFTIDKMLISCYFNAQPCHPSNFKWFRDNEYGNC